MTDSPNLTNPASRAAPGAARVVADNAEEVLAALLLFVIGASMAVQVVLRTLFDAPLTWPEELSQFLFVWASLLGAVGAIKRQHLIRLELVVEAMPRPLLPVVNVLVLVGCIAVLGLLGWYGWRLAGRTSFAATTLPITWAWAYAAAPAFAVLGIGRLLQRSLLSYRFVFIETVFASRRSAAQPVEVGQ